MHTHRQILLRAALLLCSLGWAPAPGIERLGEGRYRVERQVLQQQLSEEVLSSARVIPHRGADGQPLGYRIMGMRADTLPDRLGLKNGDIVHAVDGTALTTVDSALQIYQRLPTLDRFCLTLTRQGQPHELCYEIR